jgi:hypothetical protein
MYHYHFLAAPAALVALPAITSGQICHPPLDPPTGAVAGDCGQPCDAVGAVER